MKRIKLHFFTVLTMTLLALSAPAHDFEVDGIYYNIINGNEATVTYKGTNYSSYEEYIGSVNIPATVTYDGMTYDITSIGGCAFYNCSGLTSVTIPNAITTIGESAFFGCNELTSITIPNSVTTIGDNAFSGTAWYDNQPDGLVYAGRVAYKYKGTMPSGTNITIKEGTVFISYFAFEGCSGLTSVTIPNSVTTIGDFAFAGCSGLTNITIPNSVIEIGYSAFEGTAWYENQPDGPVYAGRVAYKYKGTMPSGTSITIKEGTVSISNSAFEGCSGLTSITIPNTITTIYDFAFEGCSGLTSITIPNSVTTIGCYAFKSCYGLTSVSIGNSVTTIYHNMFYNCNLTSISVESGNPNYDSRNNCNAIIETASNTLIIGCMNTTIPNSITTIGEYAFSDCDELTSINIPNSVTTIEYGAFGNCIGLTSVTIGSSVTAIGGWAFGGCSGLTSVTSLAITPPSIGGAYAFPSDVTSQATLYVPRESVAAYQIADNWKDFSQIVEFDFEMDGMYYCALTDNTAMVISKPDEKYYQGDVVIPEGVTYEGYTFTVTAIDAGAFEDCYELNSVVIGDAVESIGENAFQGCTDLTSVTIGSGVTNISAKAFNYCNALQTVTCLGTVPPVMASSNCFSTATYNRAKLVVPRPEIETYAATDYWYKFSHIEGWGYLGPGDVNGSGTIDMDDLTRLINIMLTDDLGGIDPSWADVTGNGIVSMNDLTELINLLLTQ